MNYPSKIIQETVEQLSKLPGIGKKTALRLTLFLLRQPEEFVKPIAESLLWLKSQAKVCQRCCNIADYDLCNICSNPKREQHIICVVKDVQDVLAIESTHFYTGLYHVLGGLIDPVAGIGPDKINLSQLLQRIKHEPISEVIFALNATIEGDITIHYVAKRIQSIRDVKMTTISRGIPVGGELEYVDETTLGRSLQHRVTL
ncbi:MAG: recombination mediator RecR [Bacteroidia bacterium]|nr:recombination mediator RecR [Bacteroidia bacterium]MDW8346282.1 recombination mediator RecR [Bacteroidia bacterium]